METLTIRQAYNAMYVFLEQLYDLTKSDDLGNLLTSMSLMSDDEPIDQAIWQDWLTAVNKVKEGKYDSYLKFE